MRTITVMPDGKTEEWESTVNLRFIERFFIPVKILQQLWISNTGEQKWIDVPTEKEE